MMRPSFFCFLLLALAVALVITVDASIVESTCSTISQADQQIQYNFCVGSLASSRSADMKGLAVSAATMSVSRFQAAKQKAASLLKQSSAPSMNQVLNTCIESYSDSIPNLSDSINAIKAGRYGDAKTWLSAATNSPNDCEGAFTEMHMKSLLSKEDSDCEQLSIIALAITNRL